MDLQTPIYRLGKDVFTLEECTTGTVFLGANGSGKTSSSQLLARSFLRKGMGGLVLTAKVGETDRWVEYARKEGREKDLLIFSPSNRKLKFNPLLYALKSLGEAGGDTENILGLLVSTMELNGRAMQNSSSGSAEPFWNLARDRLLRAVINLLLLAGVPLTFANIIAVIRDIPQEGEFSGNGFSILRSFNRMIASDDPEDRFEFEQLADTNFCIRCLLDAYHNLDLSSPSEQEIFDVVKTYFLSEFARLASKTRTSITEQLYAFIDPFRTGMLAEIFADGISEELFPETTYMDNRILVLDFPVKRFLDVGIISQGLFKHLWQKKIEQRDTRQYPMPNFLWQDEYHLFANRYDTLFQSTARESRVCSVMLTQSLSGLYATLGGANTKEFVHALLANLNTKIFCANDDHDTTTFAANAIGKTFRMMDTISFGGKAGGSFADQLHYQVEPIEFALFRRGGPQNDFTVDAVVTSTGKKFGNGKNFIRVEFQQNI